MPFGEWDDYNSCVQDMMEEQGYDRETAERVCGKLEEELKQGHKESVKEIISNLKQGAKAILEDLKLDIVSAVDTPAQPSNWVLMKSKEADSNKWSTDTPLFISKQEDTNEDEDEEEKQVAYAPALVPGVSDREGDIVPASEIEKAAHGFVKNQRNDSIDTDHDLMTGKGSVVESWILKEDRGFTLPSGESKEYKKGTWMLGIEFEDKAWKRIKEGDLQGLSIYGRSEEIDLDKELEEEKEFNNKEKQNITNSNKNLFDLLMMSETMSETKKEEDGVEYTEKEEKLFEKFNELQESIECVEQRLESKEEDDEEDEDEDGGDEEKQEIENLTDAIDWLEENAPEEIVNMVVDAVREGEGEETQEASENKEEEQTKEETEPNTEKGYDGEGTREQNLEEKEKDSDRLELPNRKELIEDR